MRMPSSFHSTDDELEPGDGLADGVGARREHRQHGPEDLETHGPQPRLAFTERDRGGS